MGQELGELLVGGLLDFEWPVRLWDHVCPEEIAAEDGELHFLGGRLPRLREGRFTLDEISRCVDVTQFSGA